MDEIIKLNHVTDYNMIRGVPTLHPLITVVDISKAQPMPAKTYYFGLYAIFLKELKCGELRYGRNHYDYQEGSLVFVAPGQIVGVEPNVKTLATKGWALLFHPDLIRGTDLGRQMHNYSFFAYHVNEALHMSEQERDVIVECFRKIEMELKQSIDKHSKKLIVSNIELLLDYSVRFYDRQFITRDHAHSDLLERFEALLHEYLHSGLTQENGIPSVSYFAEKLHLSTNYFSDLLRKETGRSAKDYIIEKLIDVAKEKIYQPGKSISEISYELGFKYPQHFTRFFKQHVGHTPNEYRSLN